MKQKATTFFAAIFIFLFCQLNDGIAAEQEQQQSAQDHLYSFSLYGGTHVRYTLNDIITSDAVYSDDNKIIVVALAREVYRLKDLVSFEIEGQVGHHSGDTVDYWEFVGQGLARWHPFPWDSVIDTSFAIGAGLSSTSSISSLERKDNNNAQRLMGYLSFELTFGLPSYPRWDLLARIHHRSGMGEVIGENRASNYVCAGLKYAF